MLRHLPARSVWLRLYPIVATLCLVAQRALALEAGPDAPPAEASVELEVTTDEFAIPGVRFHVAVDPLVRVRDVHAYLPGVNEKRVRLRRDPATGVYTGYLTLSDTTSRDEITVRVVARGRGRERFTETLRVPVLSDLCCEDEGEYCGIRHVPAAHNSVRIASRSYCGSNAG
jgi:hypothetical protein